MTATDASMNGTTPFIQYVTIVFMLISSCPFLLILSSLSGNFFKFFKNQQVKGFILLNVIVATAVAISLIYMNDYDLEKALEFHSLT